MSEVYAIFRRSKTYQEMDAEYESAKSFGQEIDRMAMDPWLHLGNATMVAVPVTGAVLFLNGIRYEVRDVTWDLRIQTGMRGSRPRAETSVMITLGDIRVVNNLAPDEPFI